MTFEETKQILPNGAACGPPVSAHGGNHDCGSYATILHC